ncbi:MAG: c-type cytochrome [Planctomycetes bacterium]|uniref:c-type cytochrome n=1 Tax=Candidatus Wunengus californicus TaxID=3367619 RepID=UPI00402520FF|nr:c-type cytochrome [Planctomycetota bacterium]
MYKMGIFAAASIAVITGMVTFFPGGPVSKAADIDAKKLYMTHCKICHGENGKPTDLGAGLEARDFTDAAWQAKATDEQIIKQINDGTPEKMMPFKEKLTPDEVKALVPIVRSFGKK